MLYCLTLRSKTATEVKHHRPGGNDVSCVVVVPVCVRNQGGVTEVLPRSLEAQIAVKLYDHGLF